MKFLKHTLCLALFSVLSLTAFADEDPVGSDAISTDWESISLGKLQKKPLFKDPVIQAKFVYENGTEYLHLSLKYMFTDAVFDDAVPVEYYKNQKIEFNTRGGKYELKAAKYAKARRMNFVAQKTADLKVIFVGDLSFLRDNLIKDFVVHYAQGYQNISLNKDEASNMQEAYNRFLVKIGAKQKETAPAKTKAAPAKAAPAAVEAAAEEADSPASIERLRRQAKRWGR